MSSAPSKTAGAKKDKKDAPAADAKADKSGDAKKKDKSAAAAKGDDKAKPAAKAADSAKDAKSPAAKDAPPKKNSLSKPSPAASAPAGKADDKKPAGAKDAAKDDKKAVKKKDDEKKSDGADVPTSPSNVKKPPSRPSSALKRPPSSSGKPAAGGGGGVRNVDLKDIQSGVDSVWSEGRIPLILDASGKVDTFYSYNNAVFIEAKNLFLRKFHQTIPFEDLMDECRKKVVSAMKSGLTLVVSLTDSATDFLKTFNSDVCFPTEKIFQPSELAKESTWSKLVKAEEKEGGVFVVHKDFKVLVTSAFYPDDYEFFLSKSIPLKYCAPINVTGATQEVKD